MSVSTMKSTIDKGILTNLIQSRQYEFFLFDLDNTLYDERLYLFPAYKEISLYIGKHYGLNPSETEQFLITGFENAGRSNLFNRLCAKFQIPEPAMPDMLHILRTVHLPAPIGLFEKAKHFMEALLKAGKKIYVITNGNVEQQQNKIHLIEWHGMDKQIEFVLASGMKPKPEKGCF